MWKKRALRLAMGFGGAATLGACYIGLVLFRAQGGIPPWDGTVGVAGLGQAVEVLRDETGTPHISAASLEDLYLAQGFVHAQDRFWQMALTRQLLLGRLAEWVGASALSSDRGFRAWDLSRRAAEGWRSLPESERRLVEAYSRGVNAWLMSPEFRRPPEMVVLHVRPTKWRPSDSVLLFFYFQFGLTVNGGELLTAVLGAHAPDPGIAEVLGPRGLAVPVIIGGAADDSSNQPTGPFPEGDNSDNWTLSGAHTRTGKPLMANDPHLGPSLPSVWQLQRHDAPGIHGAGATYPGVPGITLGHNGALAWGMTNAAIDGLDITLLQPDPTDPTRYRRTPEGAWQSFELRVEEFEVRFGRDVVDTVRATPTGVVWPVWNGPPLSTDRSLVQERRMWGLELPATHAAGILRLQTSRTVEEGISAAESIPSPYLNLSLADTTGGIGYVTVGRLFDRSETAAGSVAFGPEDGNEGRPVPVDENPRVLNPPSGRIVTANQRVVGPDYPYYLTAMWPFQMRAVRIHELLDEQDEHDISSFLAMQVDAMSPVARRVLPLLLEVDPPGESEAELVAMLRDWDHRFTLDSAAPTVFMTWLGFLDRAIIRDELDPIPSWAGDTEYRSVADALSEDSSWCDDRRTEVVESCREILVLTLTEARRALDEAFGPDSSDWDWGSAGRFTLPHVPFDGIPLLGSRFSRSTPIPGGPESLFANYLDGRAPPPFATPTSIPTYQAIYDLADLDASLFMAFGGSSGHFKSPFYNNLTAPWAAGQRFSMPSGGVATLARLVLQPAPS